MGSSSSPYAVLHRFDKLRSAAAARVAVLIEGRIKALSSLFPDLRAYSPFPKDPDGVISQLSDSIVAALLLPDPSRRLMLADAIGVANQTTIYDSGHGTGVLAWRDRSAILIEANNGAVRSWSGLRSVTGIGNGKYSKHLWTSGNKKASRYFQGKDPTDLELAVFSKGIGHFSTPARMFMYGGFKSDIGVVVDPSHRTAPTRFLKVQFDRLARPKRGPENKKTSQGYFLKCHGFPISQRELYAEFPAGAADVANMALAV